MSAFFLASKDRNADSRFVHAPDGVGTAFRVLIQEGVVVSRIVAVRRGKARRQEKHRAKAELISIALVFILLEGCPFVNPFLVDLFHQIRKFPYLPQGAGILIFQEFCGDSLYLIVPHQNHMRC